MISEAQRDMLRTARRWSGQHELGELVMECATRYDGALAWRIADRTAGALLRRGLITLDGDVVHISVAGCLALDGGQS